jgi:hypothetical protein
MARFIFGGDPRRLSEANILFINHGYNTFFNKISGTSMEQWLPRDLLEEEEAAKEMAVLPVKVEAACWT